MKDLKYIPLNASDFLADQNVALMSTEQIGAYILLLLYAWSQTPAGTVPNNDEWLCAWTRTTPDRWHEIKEGVMRPFQFNDSTNRWEQPRMRDTYVQVLKTMNQKSENGKRAARARWGDESDGNANALLNSKKEIPNRKYTEKATWDENDGWDVPESLLLVWSETYVSLDVNKELAKMNAWLLSNPSKRYKHWKRFVNGWLNRSQEQINVKGSTNGNSEYEESEIGNAIRVR